MLTRVRRFSPMRPIQEVLSRAYHYVSPPHIIIDNLMTGFKRLIPRPFVRNSHILHPLTQSDSFFINAQAIVS